MFPNEILNHICSYIEGPNNKIIKELCFLPIECLKLNRSYNFKHVNIIRLLDAIHKQCPHCLNRLNPTEYKFKSTYEYFFNEKLCFDCLERQHTRFTFELSEWMLGNIIIGVLIGGTTNVLMEKIFGIT